MLTTSMPLAPALRSPLGETVLRYVHGVVLAVLPPLEVVVDGDLAVGKRLAVFADFPLDRERDVLEFTQYFGPAALFSFHVLYDAKERAPCQGDGVGFSQKKVIAPSPHRNLIFSFSRVRWVLPLAQVFCYTMRQSCDCLRRFPCRGCSKFGRSVSHVGTTGRVLLPGTQNKEKE